MPEMSPNSSGPNALRAWQQMHRMMHETGLPATSMHLDRSRTAPMLASTTPCISITSTVGQVISARKQQHGSLRGTRRKPVPWRRRRAK